MVSHRRFRGLVIVDLLSCFKIHEHMRFLVPMRIIIGLSIEAIHVVAKHLCRQGMGYLTNMSIITFGSALDGRTFRFDLNHSLINTFLRYMSDTCSSTAVTFKYIYLMSARPKISQLFIHKQSFNY